MKASTIRLFTTIMVIGIGVLSGCDSSEEVPLPIADFSAAEVASMEVAYAGEMATFMQQEVHEWLRHSVGHQHTHFRGAETTTHRHVLSNPVDERLIGGAIELLASLKAEGVPDDEAVRLANPTLTIGLRRQAEDAPFLTLYLAPSGSPSGTYYLRTSANEQVFLISSSKITPVLELMHRTQPVSHEH